MRADDAEHQTIDERVAYIRLTRLSPGLIPGVSTFVQQRSCEAIQTALEQIPPRQVVLEHKNIMRLRTECMLWCPPSGNGCHWEGTMLWGVRER